jgi:hypothetical protein
VGRAREQVVLAYRAKFEDAVRADLGGGAYLYVLSDHGVRPYFYVQVQLGLGVYYRGGVYLGCHVVLP